MNITRQKGVAMVEFSLIALMFFMLIFGAIEFARAWFVYNTLTEATRRGARIAAVCPADLLNGRVRVVNAVLFNSNLTDLTPGTGLLGLVPNNVKIRYLDGTGGSMPGLPTGHDDSDWYNELRFVQVSLTDENDPDNTRFTHNLIIPFIGEEFFTPSFSTTLPRESMGRIDANNPVTVRIC